jgi:mRNA interferase MazF
MKRIQKPSVSVEVTLSSLIRRGDIWLINLDPVIGSEIRKTRPCVIISSDAVGILPVKLIAPVTAWDDRYTGNLWHIRIDSTPGTGLSKTSAVDALQVRAVDTARMIRRVGKVAPHIMVSIVEAVAAVIEVP